MDDDLDDYKLDTTWYQDPSHITHVSFERDRRHRGRKVRIENKWFLQKELGVGSCSVVHLETNEDGKERAVKSIRKSLAARLKIDYRRELAAISTFSKAKYQQHQIFVEFLGWFESPEFIFVAMEYLPLGDLSKHISEDIQEHDLKDISSQLLEGLRLMHSKGFTHRDLKPQNIFVVQKTPSWWVKIGDFGISKRVRECDATELRTATGTQGYEAPEIRGYVEVDEQGPSSIYTNVVDIWSFGCVVYKVVAKKVPFKTGRDIKWFCDEKIPFPVEPLQERLSDHGIEFLRSILVPKPLARPSADIALQHLWLAPVEEYLESHSQTEPESTPKEDIHDPLEATIGEAATLFHSLERQENLGHTNAEIRQFSDELETRRMEMKKSIWSKRLGLIMNSGLEGKGSPTSRRPPSLDSPGQTEPQRSSSLEKNIQYRPLERKRSPEPVIFEQYPAKVVEIEDQSGRGRWRSPDELSLDESRLGSPFSASFLSKGFQLNKKYGISSTALSGQQFDESEDNNSEHIGPEIDEILVMEQKWGPVRRNSESSLELIEIGLAGEVTEPAYAAGGLASLTRAQSQEAESLSDLGQLAFEVRKYVSAIDFWTKALFIKPGEAFPLYGRAMAYNFLGDYNNSLADAEAVVVTRPHWSRAWYLLADLRERHGDLKGSMEAYRKCIELEGDNDIEGGSWFREKAKTRLAILEAEQKKRGIDQGSGIQGNNVTPSHLKVTVNCEGNFVRLVAAFNISYQALVGRLDAKMGRFINNSIEQGTMRLQYRDKSGVLFRINCDEDIQVAFEGWRNGGKRKFYRENQLGEIKLLCTSVTEVKSFQGSGSSRGPPAPRYLYIKSVGAATAQHEEAALGPVSSPGEQRTTEPINWSQNIFQSRPSTSHTPTIYSDRLVRANDYQDVDIEYAPLPKGISKVNSYQDVDMEYVPLPKGIPKANDCQDSNVDYVALRERLPKPAKVSSVEDYLVTTDARDERNRTGKGTLRKNSRRFADA